MADGRGRSLATRITPGQASDTKELVALLDKVSVARPGGIGRPRKRPDSLAGDKAYSSRANRRALRARKIVAVIPERDDQIANRVRKGRRGGRSPGLDIGWSKIHVGWRRRVAWCGDFTCGGRAHPETDIPRSTTGLNGYASSEGPVSDRFGDLSLELASADG